ncbi:hypothetical protein PVAG01_06605 [Phlyctema vagabunda]|uniref:Uncharacterized protein n=1 Tax=Phlyctema vagabunda TaxID=108571 RepID=A0ABR4PGJ1_9HELO
MTDHRVDDLSYGHLGEATYDIDTKEWDFSREVNDEYHFHRVTPFIECIHASLADVPDTKKRPSHIARDYERWLKKAHPEVLPAYSVAATLHGTASNVSDEPLSTAGALLAVGRVRDTVRMSDKDRTAPILAISCGKAGEVLKLVKPKVENHFWGKGTGVKLPLLDAGSAEAAYWLNTAGTIKQITFAEDEYGMGSWLAVRQAGLTTIFRPVYRKLPSHPIVPRGYQNIYPFSRLSSNPVATLKVEKAGGQEHVDVTFNPWYVRQFAVINRLGCWAIWDIEGRQQNDSGLALMAGKNGEMHKNSLADNTPKVTDIADGWHRIIWAGGVSTIVTCSRTRLAVFDVKAQPSPLQSPDLITPNSFEWILDVKRNPMNWNHLFVLTTSRIFWVEVTPAGEENDAKNGARVILSHRHFRDINDETGKLSVLTGEENSTVLVYSSKSLLVNLYRFYKRSDGSNQPKSLQSSMVLQRQTEDSLNDVTQSFQTMCITTARLTPNPASKQRGEGTQYLERNIEFYQIWLLKSDLALSMSLHAMSDGGREFCQDIIAPSYKRGHSSKSLTSRNAFGDSFVVPDGFEEKETPEESEPTVVTASANRAVILNDFALRINSRSIFEAAFSANVPGSNSDGHILKLSEDQAISDIIDGITVNIQEGKQDEHLPIATLLEMTNFHNLTSDLDEAEQALQEFSKTFNLVEPDEASLVLVFSNLIGSAGVRFSDSERTGTITPSLLQIYDDLVRVWVTSLPLTTNGRTRLKKFQIIRNIALELCLSSVSVSLKSNPSTLALNTNAQKSDHDDACNDYRDSEQGGSRSSSPVPMSSQASQTTTRTPSLYSEATSSSTEPGEDAAILRLRQYAVSVKSRPDISTGPAWLKDWPEKPGVDPATFSWENAQRVSMAAEIDSGDEDAVLAKREEARRKRRTEKFLRRERSKALQLASSQPASSRMGSSQPDITRFGSQPDAYQTPAFSSQVTPDIPMTQPNRGTFGSRPVKPTTKTKKKRRAAGFR